MRVWRIIAVCLAGLVAAAPPADGSSKPPRHTAIRCHKVVVHGRAKRTCTATKASRRPALERRAPALFGFNDNSVSWGQLAAPASAALAARAGAGVSRLHFDWRYAEPRPGLWNLAATDAVYAADVAAGIRPILVVTYAPDWTFDAGVTCRQAIQDCRYPPGASHLDAWRDAIQTLARRYPRLAAIEVWNEPNLKMFWSSGPDPRRYATLVEEAYDAARAVGSGVAILGGALSAASDRDEAAHPTTMMSYRHFLKGMYDAGVRGHMDGLSLHPYPEDADLWRFFEMLTDVRDIRDAAGDDTPLWVTEIGATTTGWDPNFTFDDDSQAWTLERVVAELRAMPDVRAIVAHPLLEPVRYPFVSGERGYGVVRADGTPRPAFCALSGTCSAPSADQEQQRR